MDIKRRPSVFDIIEGELGQEGCNARGGGGAQMDNSGFTPSAGSSVATPSDYALIAEYGGGLDISGNDLVNSAPEGDASLDAGFAMDDGLGEGADLGDAGAGLEDTGADLGDAGADIGDVSISIPGEGTFMPGPDLGPSM